MNFGERFLNVHVRESNRGNDAIETFSLEWQALSGSELIHAVWKSSAGSRQTRSVDVEPRTSSAEVTPHENRSTPEPQPKSSTRMARAPGYFYWHADDHCWSEAQLD